MIHSTPSEQTFSSVLFTEEELAIIALRGSDPTLEYDNDMYNQACEALKRYYAMRNAVIDLIANGDPDTLSDPTNAQLANDIEKFYFNQILSTLQNGEYALDDQCELLHRFSASIDLILTCGLFEKDEDEDFETYLTNVTGSYDGPVTEAARDELIRALAYRFATMNVTQINFNKVSRYMFSQSAANLSLLITYRSIETVVYEALNIYTLAHEGKLSQLSPEITIEECVQLVSISHDLSALHDLERKGQITSVIVTIIATLLIFALLLCTMLVWAPMLLEFSVPLGIAAYFLPAAVIAACSLSPSNSDSLITPIAHKLDKLSRYVSIMLPFKFRAWLNRRKQSDAPVEVTEPPTVPADEPAQNIDVNPDTPDVDASVYA